MSCMKIKKVKKIKKIKTGDKVIMISGDYVGKEGVISKVLPAKSRVIVSGVNLVKRHTKPTRTSEGGVKTKELSVHISNLSIVDQALGVATKVGYKIVDGKKVRYSKVSGEVIADPITYKKKSDVKK